jgi:hypothetical protein
VQYFLALYMDPRVWDALSEGERQAVFAGHLTFQETVKASGEFAATAAFAEPGRSLCVTARDGATEVVGGLYQQTPMFCCGYYIVECSSAERAAELAALIPDARHTAIDVRPIIA